MGRYIGRCAGHRSDGVVSWVIGRARERWGGMWGDGEVYMAMGTARSDGEVYGALNRRAREL